MISLRIQNESLDLPLDAQMEIEENNPLLQLGETVMGDFSLPLEALATARNIRLLNYQPVLQRQATGEAIAATLYDAGLQMSSGKVKLEKMQQNLNYGREGRISFFYLTGTAHFWQDVKKLKLREIDLGGVQNFDWTGFTLNGNGFWQHIHRVLHAAPRTYDYCFYTALADDFSWSNDVNQYRADFINALQFRNGVQQFRQYLVHLSPGFTEGNDVNPIVPQVYLQPVLVKAVALAGWRLEGAILTDPDFNRITFNTLRAIDWNFFVGGAKVMNVLPRPRVSFNLVDHIPDIDISTFLLSLRNRFGWWYDIDRVNKIVRIRELKDVAFSVVKDMTRKAGPIVPRTVLSEKVIYALRNTAGGGGGGIDLSGLNYQGELHTAGNLPGANSGRADHVFLIRNQNNYVICAINDAGQWQWDFLMANTSDVVPAGFSQEVISGSTVCTLEYLAGIGAGDHFPRITGSGYWQGRNEDNQSNDIQLCYHFGPRPDHQGRLWSFASHHVFDGAGNQLANWSLSFSGKDGQGNEVGLYERNWKAFLKRLISAEEMEVTLYLNRAEFMSLQFSDVLVIAGVKMYIKQRRYSIPYRNAVVLQCLRVQL